MHYIAKHDTKQEWEGDNRKYGRIDFFVQRNTISINNLLERPSKLIGFNIGRSDVNFFIKDFNLLDLKSSKFFLDHLDFFV